MPANTSSDERNEYSYPPYKKPLSAKIIAVLAIINLIIGILFLILGIYINLSAKNNTSNASFNHTIYSLIGTLSILNFLKVFGFCLLVSAILFVIYNIACDVHQTNYNMQVLLRSNQKNQKELVKNLQYIDDSITRQCGVIIHQINKKAPAQERPRQQESNAHDGAF